MADAGASRRQSVHAPAAACTTSISTPLSEARIVAPFVVRGPQPQDEPHVGRSIHPPPQRRCARRPPVMLRAGLFGKVPAGIETAVVIAADVERARRGQRRHRRLADAHGVIARFKRGRDRRAATRQRQAEHRSRSWSGVQDQSRSWPRRSTLRRGRSSAGDASHSAGAAPSSDDLGRAAAIHRGVPTAIGEDVRDVHALRGAQHLAWHFAAQYERGRWRLRAGLLVLREGPACRRCVRSG